ncbi:MAG: hypothetical protein HC934_06420 [Acaryochloridaceae cyanobacterium SU_2_1]|nr:hypothetical protein [Acaryochloridaceae cyanobacterium SU_2_1]
MDTPYKPWSHKPWWCQPWSIVLTGIGLILGSWLLAHRIWLTAIVALPVLAWMGLFLIVWPRAMAQMMAESQDGGESSEP